MQVLCNRGIIHAIQHCSSPPRGIFQGVQHCLASLQGPFCLYSKKLDVGAGSEVSVHCSCYSVKPPPEVLLDRFAALALEFDVSVCLVAEGHYINLCAY